MVEDRKMRFAVAIVEARTAEHQARGEKRCGCGACAHWVIMAAHWTGVDRAKLVAALPEPAKAATQRRRVQRGLRVQICESGTVRFRGSDAGEAAGLALLLGRLHGR